MTEQKHQVVQLTRDCIARMVPQGAQIVLREGTEVKIVQDLGNSYSVDVYGNLARIEGHDADALGKKPHNWLIDLEKHHKIDDKINLMLSTVYDPEIPVSIRELGLIYKVDILPNSENSEHYNIYVEMTLTAPGCGMGPVIVEDVKAKLLLIPEVDQVDVEMVFDPPWERSMVSEAAKLQLGIL